MWASVRFLAISMTTRLNAEYKGLPKKKGTAPIRVSRPDRNTSTLPLASTVPLAGQAVRT